MKYLMIVLAMVALSGCDRAGEKLKAEFTGSADASALTQYVDKQHGVVCYETHGRDALSCVQVMEGTHK